jgi:lactoylglutathione lyase
MKLAYTIVYVPDVAASLRFFSDAFGLPPCRRAPDGTLVELRTAMGA